MLQLAEFSRSQLADLNSGRLAHQTFLKRKEEIYSTLRTIGADRYDFWLPETHALPLVIQPNEQILGVVYGRYKFHRVGTELTISRGTLVATNMRVLLVNKKPFFISCEEIKYDAISGVTYSRVGPAGHIVLHTKLGDIDIRTFNQHTAQHFIQAIEAICLQGGLPNKSDKSTTVSGDHYDSAD